jgi:hypothetical protein
MIQDILEPMSHEKLNRIEDAVMQSFSVQESKGIDSELSNASNTWVDKLCNLVNINTLALATAAFSISIVAVFMMSDAEQFPMRFSMAVNGQNLAMRGIDDSQNRLPTYYSSNEMIVFLKPEQNYSSSVQVQHYLKNDERLYELSSTNSFAQSGAVKSEINVNNWATVSSGEYQLISVVAQSTLPRFSDLQRAVESEGYSHNYLSNNSILKPYLYFNNRIDSACFFEAEDSPFQESCI